jgi:hypothetical protein
MKRKWLAIATAVAAAGCGGARAIPEPRAYLVRATPESHLAVVRAVEQALEVPNITLPPDVLTQESSFEVGRNQQGGGDPRPMVGGHDPGGPGLTERFHLVKVGEHCILIRDRTDHHYDLVGATCQPE